MVKCYICRIFDVAAPKEDGLRGFLLTNQVRPAMALWGGDSFHVVPLMD